MLFLWTLSTHQPCNSSINWREIRFLVFSPKLNSEDEWGHINIMYYMYLFSKWLEYGILLKVPKASTEKVVYIAVSLLSCVCKVYSDIINKSIEFYYEICDIVWQTKWSWEEHILIDDGLTLTEAFFGNRLSENKDTFACLINMKTTFNWVDREFLFL